MVAQIGHVLIQIQSMLYFIYVLLLEEHEDGPTASQFPHKITGP
jgi:hypothetical protein